MKIDLLLFLSWFDLILFLWIFKWSTFFIKIAFYYHHPPITIDESKSMLYESKAFSWAIKLITTLCIDNFIIVICFMLLLLFLLILGQVAWNMVWVEIFMNNFEVFVCFFLLMKSYADVYALVFVVFSI